MRWRSRSRTWSSRPLWNGGPCRRVLPRKSNNPIFHTSTFRDSYCFVWFRFIRFYSILHRIARTCNVPSSKLHGDTETRCHLCACRDKGRDRCVQTLPKLRFFVSSFPLETIRNLDYYFRAVYFPTVLLINNIRRNVPFIPSRFVFVHSLQFIFLYFCYTPHASCTLRWIY